MSDDRYRNPRPPRPAGQTPPPPSPPPTDQRYAYGQSKAAKRPVPRPEPVRPKIDPSWVDDEVLNIEDVAQLLKMEIGTIRKMRSTGDFARAARLGKRLKWRKSDILKWYEEHLDEE